MPPTSAFRDVLVEAEVVPLRVLEPRGLLGAEDADVVDGLEAGQVVILEDDARLLQFGDARGDGKRSSDRADGSD